MAGEQKPVSGLDLIREAHEQQRVARESWENKKPVHLWPHSIMLLRKLCHVPKVILPLMILDSSSCRWWRRWASPSSPPGPRNAGITDEAYEPWFDLSTVEMNIKLGTYSAEVNEDPTAADPSRKENISVKTSTFLSKPNITYSIYDNQCTTTTVWLFKMKSVS